MKSTNVRVQRTAGFVLANGNEYVSDSNSIVSKPRYIYEIAGEVRRDWTKVYFGAVPYLDAMFSLRTASDMYGADNGRTIVVYFLANASTWRGETARRVKKELKSMI